MYQATYDNGALSLKINEVEVSLSNVIDTVKLTYDSGTSELACGSLIIPTLEFTLLNTVSCVLMDTVELNVGNIPFHKFIVVSADKQEYITKFKAYVEPYERLSKGFFGDLEDGYTVHSMLNEIATKAGVIIDGVGSLPNLPLTRGDVTATGDDGTEQTQKGTNYVGKTYLEQLSLISGFLGKNIIFTRNNHIKFTNLNTTDIVLTDLEKPTRKTNSYSINKIICSTGRDTELVAGSATLSETLSLSNCYMTQEQLNALLTQFQAIEYEAFEFNHAQANLLIEPYDMVSFEYKGQNYVIPVQYLQIVFSAKGANYIVKSFVKQGESAVSEYKGTLTSRVDNVYTEVMQVRQLIANIGQFEEIEAVVAKIDNLYAKVGHIQNLLAGTITSEEINTIHLTSQNAVIDNAIVKSEMIESLAVSKLASGVIDTSKIQIQATNGHMTIADNTIRFIDSKGNTRLYMGEDTNGNFSYQVYNANGTGLLLDENGLKEIAITDGLIKTNMINNQAITGDKINWTSFCESFNSSTNTNTLDSAHITMDGKRLDTAFNQLNTTVNGQTETINTHTSQLTQNANSIQGLITATTITKEDGTTVGVKDEIANMKLTQDSFQVSISERVDNIDTNITNAKNEAISSANNTLNSTIANYYTKSQTDSQINVAKEAINLGVSNTYETKTNVETKINNAVDNIKIGGNNLISKTSGYTMGYISTYGGNVVDEVNSNQDFYTNDYFFVKQGNPVTFTLYPKDGVTSSIKSAVLIHVYDTDKVWQKYVRTEYNVANTVATVTYTAESDCYVRFSSRGYHVYNHMAEFSNKASEWSPSSIDVAAQITNAKNEAISSSNNTLNTTIANYYTKSQTDSQINVAKDAINLSVSNTYETKANVETKTNTALNNAKSYADTKKSEAISMASTDATNKVNSAKTELNTAIGKKANSTDVYTKAEVYTKSQTDSAINVAKEAINLGVSQTYETKTDTTTKINNAVNGIKIGGTNLITKKSGYVHGYIGEGDGSLNNTGSLNANQDFYTTEFIFVKNGTPITFTSYPKQGVTSTIQSAVYIHFYNTDKVWQWCKSNKTSANNIATTTYTTTGDCYIRFSARGFNDYNHMAEFATKPSEWSPSPKDVDVVINAKANSADVYKKSEVYTKSQTDSAINVAKDAINLGVSNTYETKANVQTKVTSTLNSAKSYADTKKTEAVNSAASDATSKVNAAKTELNTAIGKKANSADVYTKTQVYTKDETNSQINVAKNAITQSVSSTYETKANVQTKIDATMDRLKIDGNNLITKKRDFMYGYLSHTTGGTNNTGSTLNDNQDFYTSTYFPIKKGESVTFASYPKSGVTSGINVGVYIHVYNTSKAWVKCTYKDVGVNVFGSVTYTADADGYVRFSSRGFNDYNHKAVYGKNVGEWSPSPLDIEVNVSNLTTRVSTAEQKITDTAITNTVKQNFYTKTETNNQITSKGYQTSSQVQQTVDALKLKFTQSGGYNRIRNGIFKNGTSHWSKWGSATVSTKSDTGHSYGKSLQLTTTGGNQGVWQDVSDLCSGKTYTVSAYVYTWAANDCGIQIHCGDNYYASQVPKANQWQRISVTFKATSTSATVQIGRGSWGANGNHLFTAIQFEEGELATPYTPHPSEVYDGIIQMDKDGIKVSATNFGGYTHMTNLGFFLNNGTTDVLRMDTSGLKIGSNPNTSINGDVIRSGNIVSNNSDLTFNLNSGKMYYKYASQQVGFLGVTDGNAFSLSTDAKGWCMNSDYGSFSSMGAKSASGGNYVPYLTVTSGGVSNYNAGIFLSMPLNYGSATGINMTVKSALELSAKVDGAGLFNPKIAWRGTDVVTGATLFPRSAGDRIDIYSTGDSSGSHLTIRLADDVHTYFKITCNHYTYGHQAIATFRYVESIDGYGIDFYRGLNMHNYNLGNVSLKNAKSVQTASLALLDDVATVQTASPTAMYALDNGIEATQATITQHIATSINKTVTFNGTELVEGTSEYIELPQDFLMCVDIQVTLTPNKLCRFAVTSKDEYGFVIETDTEGVTFDYVVIGTKMDGTLFAGLHEVEPDTCPINDEEEFVPYTTDNLMLPQELIDKGYTTFADATEEEMEAMKFEQVFGSPVEEEEVVEDEEEEVTEEEVTEETQEDIIIENEDDLNGIDTGTIIENY